MKLIPFHISTPTKKKEKNLKFFVCFLIATYLNQDPWYEKIPWRRKWQPTPVFLSGKSHGQRSLVGYSPQGCKELDMTEATCHAPSMISVTAICLLCNIHAALLVIRAHAASLSVTPDVQ